MYWSRYGLCGTSDRKTAVRGQPDAVAVLFSGNALAPESVPAYLCQPGFHVPAFHGIDIIWPDQGVWG